MKIYINPRLAKTSLGAVFLLFFVNLSNAQDIHQEHEKDSLQPKVSSHPKTKEKIFGLEEEAVDSFARIETLEIGGNNHKDIAFFSSIKFPVNNFASGRLFIASFRINKNGNGKPGHYSTGALDLTLFDAPIDLAFGLDNDRLGKNPYRRSEFLGLALYLNDIHKFHKIFHIARYSPSYHFYHTNGEDSLSKQKNGIQHSVFLQTQPIRFTKNWALSTETYFLARKNSNILEFDLGFRNKHFMDERFVFGTTFAFHNMEFHGIMFFGRLSIMQTNGVKKNWGLKRT